VMADDADRPVPRRQPHFAAAGGAAGNLDVAAASAPGGLALACFPADGDGAWLPRMVQPALGRYARPDR